MTAGVASGCPGIDALNPLCQAVSAGSSVADAGASAIFSAMASWVVSGASWLLTQVGGVLATSTSIDVSASWFDSHYQVMVAIAGVVAVPLLMGTVLQALYRQSVDLLLRTALVHLPLALLFSGVAIELVQLSLAVTDALCTSVTAGSSGDVSHALSGLANSLVAQIAEGDQGVPSFVVLLIGLLVAFGAFLLWVELVVRAAAVYVTVLFLPLALVSLVWPAISHWCRRLVDTLAALVLSKFVIVAILGLASGALASGSSDGGFAAVLSGAAILLLATFAPFVLLRIIPIIEGSAAQHLEGARHRVQQPFGSLPRSAASFALRQARAEELPGGGPGTGRGQSLEPPGGESMPIPVAGGGEAMTSTSSPGPSPQLETTAGQGPAGQRPAGHHSGHRSGDPMGSEIDGIPQWQGNPASNAAYEAALRSRPSGSGSARGPLPVTGERGSAVGTPGDGAVEGNPTATATHVAPSARGTHVVGRDEFGPVIRWVPGPTDRPSTVTGPASPNDGGGYLGGR